MNITMVNLNGESVWYQMNKNRPEFWRAWQAMITVSTTMDETQMLPTFYAYQAFYYMFNDTNLVKVGVLPNSSFTPT